TPYLAKHCLPLHSAGRKPSTFLKEISWIAGGAKWQKGQLIWLIINALVPWDLYFTNRLHCFREQLREHLPLWLETWYDLEAYSALAGLGYQNPDAIMPDVVEEINDGNPVFMTRSLAHPFLPFGDRVSNDFTFARVPNIAIVTGSNMSGKSTFLRTIGINLCLAYAGGPVLATSFRTIPFRLFTSMTVSDSVTDGISYFYAEVKRLKALLDVLEASHSRPLFFLIDEVFRGTNNRERLQGSRAYIRFAVEKHGVGIVATHNLELANLEDEISDIVNYHFLEEVFNGCMKFDYLLRKGPCPTTNALKIMQLEGLPVDEKLTE
ncbi:MAG: MutS family DNA mismatch repair protein, partial [Gemmatimonadota bacterium]|nr:MutS family DNA mismatch repair protein [Gemmatimonadota bacterium]